MWCSDFYINNEPITKMVEGLIQEVKGFLEGKVDHIGGKIDPAVPKECIITAMVRAGYDVYMVELLRLHYVPVYHIIYRAEPFKLCEFYHFIGTEGVQTNTVYSCFKVV